MTNAATATTGASSCGSSGQPRPDGILLDAALKDLFGGRSVKRMLFVNPLDADATIFREEMALRRRYTNYPPYGLGVLASRLRAIGVESRILNLNHLLLASFHGPRRPDSLETLWREALDQAIAEFKPDLIGVTCMFTMSHASFRAVCAAVHPTGIPLAIGGVHITNDVERVLDDVPEANVAFLNEADDSLPAFLKAANGEGTTDDLTGVIIKHRGQRLRVPTAAPPSDASLDVLPAYDLMEVATASRYGTVGAFFWLLPNDTPIATVLSNRGCRAQCTFCSVRAFNGAGVRQRSVDNVLDELERLTGEYGIRHIMWLDDDLLKDERRIISLFNGIVRRGIALTWDATNGVIASSVTEENIAAAAASGCIALNVGLESGNPAILRQIKKPSTVANMLRAAEILQGHPGIHASVQVMLGFPGETFRQILDTINLVRRMNLDWHRISPLQPLPNTPIYRQMVADGLIVDSVGDPNVRFQGGPFGKQAEIEQGLRAAPEDFLQVFSAIGLDSVPSPAEISTIWFFMNYYVNFHRLFRENRPEKIRQQILNLANIGNVITPDNGFALYYLGYLQHKSLGGVDPEIIGRLEARLATSPFWADRMRAFELSVDHLKQGTFPHDHVPGLVPAYATGENGGLK